MKLSAAEGDQRICSLLYLENVVLPAAIYPFHSDHCLGCCISVMPTRLFGRLRLYQQSRCNCQQPSYAAGRRTPPAAICSLPAITRSLPQLSAHALPQRDIPIISYSVLPSYMCYFGTRGGSRISR